MLRLPSLTVGTADWRLPLEEDAAAQLLACLFAASPRRQVELLAQTLKTSPSFLLWLVCRTRDPASQLETVGDLAKRWSSRLLQELRWPEPARASSSWLAASEKRWRTMRDRSLHVAELAASLAAERSTGNGSARRFIGQTYLLGLLHAACEWLSGSGPAVRIGRTAARSSPLPAWLVQYLREIETGGDDGPSDVVAAAIAQYSSRSEERTVGSGATIGGGDVPLGAGKMAGSMLPHVVTRLQRLAQLESQFQETLEHEKLESLRQFAYGASHEINNPLANISTRAQTLLREETNPERRRKLATINAQAFRAHEMISDMMLYAKPPEMIPAPLDAVKLVAGVVAELAPQAAQQGTDLILDGTTDRLDMQGDSLQLAVAIRSLCINALEALGGGGTVVVAARPGMAHPDNGAEYIEFEVRDSGPGIPRASRRHLFDPFYSGREAGRGLGLGLSKCWRIVTLHGGHIQVESDAGQGATFILHIPRKLGD